MNTRSRTYGVVFNLIGLAYFLSAQKSVNTQLMLQDTSRIVKKDEGISLLPAIFFPLIPNQRPDLDNLPQLIYVMPGIRNRFFYELRFNYDADNSAGMYYGYLFSKESKITQTVIPSVGIVFGQYKGVSTQLNYQVVSGKLQVDFQNQYTWSIKRMENFYFNWSSAQYKIFRGLFSGISSQINRSKSATSWDLGYLIGYEMKKWSFFLFHFKLYAPTTQYFYFGTQFKM